ncbi:hypothetical protein AAG747_08425 [Rapidithrix thailandica]|uniref:DUF4194 domain-containing protein n=1 Tax=Rapidithrix thailandica TaxID=413964 RepID=A0AAW9SAJ9_9BACT
MNHSTENVTLYALFLSDILKNYENKKEEYPDLFQMVEELDLSEPFNKVPIKVYNEMCAWIEENLGKFNLIRVGRNVGESIYQGMLDSGAITTSTKPLEIMKTLIKMAETMIQDPEKRGWEIAASSEHSIQMRRTQTFNSKLQLGVLDGLIRKAGVGGVKVDLVKDVEAGDEFDEFLISWV